MIYSMHVLQWLVEEQTRAIVEIDVLGIGAEVT